MALPRVPVFLAYVVAGLLPLALVPTVLRNREKPGGAGTLLIVLGASLWSFAAGMGFLLDSPGVGFAVANVVLLSASLTAVGPFLTMVEYSGLLTPTRGVVAALAVEPLAVQALAWTNPAHGLLYGPGVDFGSAASIVATAQPVFWTHAALSYLFLGVAGVLAVTDVLTSRGVRRRQSLALVVSAVPPALASLWLVLRSPPVDPTPFGFVLMVFVLAWALFRAQFLDLVPVGRERAFAELEEGVITFDAENRVVDCNPAARRLLDADADYTGTPGEQFLAAIPALREHYRTDGETETEISVDRNGQTRHFDLTITSLRGPDERRAGRLVVLRDVTLLRERQQDLDLLRQVLARVLRHNIRNELTVVRGYGEVFADELDGEHADMADTLVAKADDLIELSAKARTIEQLVNEEQVVEEVDLVAMIEEIVASIEVPLPTNPVALSLPDSCRVETTSSLELAIENLVENAVEHTGEDAEIAVTLECSADEAVITVGDDGPGIPEQDLAVLDEGAETPLQHGSGIGLWVVQWVIDNSEATIEYETGPDGTEIAIRVPRG